MNLNDPIAHYHLDAELFDYFEQLHPADADSARRIQQAVAEYAGLPVPGFVLDVGSGNGWLLELCMNTGSRVVSVDLGKKNLDTLRSRYGSGILTVVADAARLPFKTGTFERVIASEIMEHLNAPESLTKEAHRLLRKGGMFVASTPYKEKLRVYLCVHCNRPTPANAHIQTFDEHRHVELLKQSKFGGISYSLLQNKIFLFTRISYVFRFLPYSLWRMIDKIFILVVRKAGTILLRAQK